MNNFSVWATIILLRADLIRIWISGPSCLYLPYNIVKLILRKLTRTSGMIKKIQYATHLSPIFHTVCECQPFRACWYWSAVQPVETGRRGCPDLMDYCMRPRGAGTSVLTWLFNPRVGRDLAVSSPPSMLILPQPFQTCSSLHFQRCITVVHRRSLGSEGALTRLEFTVQ